MTDLNQLKRGLDDVLSQVVIGMARDSMEHLVGRYMATVELESEEESHERAAQYRKQVAMIEAIGRFRFGSRFDDAVNKAAGE